ncbi:thioredoxin family protein [Nibrella saemangeumensis]
MNRIFLFALALLFTVSASYSQSNSAPGAKKIKWLTIEEAYALNKKNPKKFVIDVYTNWCGWCKVMDKNTFTAPAIIDFVNENFYPVKLNAEQREDITLGEHTFKYMASGSSGVHELAAGLLQNKLSYPSTVFMDEQFQLIQPVAGYMEPRIFHQVITYFAGNYHNKEPFDQFKTGTYVTDFKPAMPGVVKPD